MRRGQFVTIVQQGDYGKPRPALVVQSDIFGHLASVVVCPLTTHIEDDVMDVRIDVHPTTANGIRERSQVMIDKISPVSRAKVGKVIGVADEELMSRVTRAVTVLLAIE